MFSPEQKIQNVVAPRPAIELIADQIERAEEVMPIEVIRIKDNPHIKPKERKDFSFDFSMGSGGDSYSSYDYTIKKDSKFEVKGKTIKLKVSFGGTPSIASYEPSIDMYTIGPEGLKHLKNNRELFFYDVNHEAAHDEYLSLSLNDQKALNDLFIQDKGLNELLRKFATALYTDKAVSKDASGKSVGDKYLRAHDMSTPEIAAHISVENQKGVKDVRSMEILINDQEKDVLFGALVTECISFLAAFERGEEYFIKVAASYQNERNGEDPRFDVISAVHEYLMSNHELKKEFDKYGLYKNNNPEFLESFAEETKKIEWQFC